jgi:hypothetical protein
MLTKEISEVEKGCRIKVEGNDAFGSLNCGDERGHFDIETGNWIKDGFWYCPKCETKLSTLKFAQQKFDKLITQTAKKFNSEHLLKDETYELGYLLKLSQQKAVEE